jgi:hypothetical protein
MADLTANMGVEILPATKINCHQCLYRTTSNCVILRLDVGSLVDFYKIVTVSLDLYVNLYAES